MTSFPGSPRLTKGSLVVLKPNSSQVDRTISFQYNPETLSRTLQVQGMQTDGGTRSEALRLRGAPIETIKLDIEIDATDALETADRKAVNQGIHAQLAALETLIYPSVQQVRSNMNLANSGTMEIVPMEAPFTLFVWGNKRRLPVRVTEFSITEEAYDVNLNPIRAKVSLGLRVLTYDDLPWRSEGASLFFTYHQERAKLAGLNR